ncbi:tetraspanin-5-like isoform X1 [Gigantopelta aegis]|uniref:tetraspanin-5-like isoform X1 n=1 Tax=Gigantopelta aegis TaxID=1735272 RepID=UPI001B88B85B|nr:tetraspanin-5-like isoform X1 [Gigantopelta aegis]
MKDRRGKKGGSKDILSHSSFQDHLPQFQLSMSSIRAPLARWEENTSFELDPVWVVRDLNEQTTLTSHFPQTSFPSSSSSQNGGRSSAERLNYGDCQPPACTETDKTVGCFREDGADEPLFPEASSRGETGRGGGQCQDDSKASLLSPREKELRKFYKRRAAFIDFLIKYSLFVSNFLFWFAGVAAVGFGYWLLSEKGRIVTDGMYFFFDPAVMSMVNGCVVFTVAFFGCLGALRENILLLKIFQVSLYVVLIIETAVAILVFIFYTMPEVRKNLKIGPEYVLTQAVKRYHHDDGLKMWIDLIQKEFKCCGVTDSYDGFRDWQQDEYFNCSDSNPSTQRCAVPVSCCIIEPGDYMNMMCGFQTTDKSREDVFNRIFTKGCMKSFGEWLANNEVVIGAVCAGIIIPQICGVLLARMLMKRILQKREQWEWRRR